MIQEKACEMALLLLCALLRHRAQGRPPGEAHRRESRLEGEIHRLNDVIKDKDFQLLDNDELIQNLNNKLRDGGGGSD